MLLNLMGCAPENEYGIGNYSNCRCNAQMDGYVSHNHISLHKSCIFLSQKSTISSINIFSQLPFAVYMQNNNNINYLSAL